MLTDDQLEKAARAYCASAGLDPDEKVGHGAPPSSDGWAPAVLMYSPRWRIVADELLDLHLRHEALRNVY